MAGAAMTVAVKPGSAWINGYYYNTSTDIPLTLSVADGVLKRIDRVVARWSLADRNITIQLKKGSLSATPTPPLLQRDVEAFELGLADILVNAGATAITQANITDLRLNKALCGVVTGTVQQVDTTTIFNQYESWFASFTAQETADFLAWFQTIKDILDENTAGHLLNLILMRSRPATVVVAADNSSANSKGAADFVCPATGAETVINQAIAALGSFGGKVLLLEGTYRISGTINLPANATLEGMGSSDTVITRPASGSFSPLIKAMNVNRVTIRGLLLTAANTPCTCAYFEGCSDARVLDCEAYGSTLNGFHFYKCSNVVLNQSKATYCQSGIVVEGEAGLGSDAIISDNFCFSNTRNGISCRMPNLIVTGNDCRSNGGPGILLNQCSDASVCGNVSLGNTPEGIVVDGSKIEVSGNVCNNNTSAGIRAAGTDMNIASNICKSNAIYGIRVMSGSAAMTISANTCNDNQTTGIECNGTAHCLSGNTCRNNKNRGLTCAASQSAITGNNCVGSNDGSGIYAEGTNFTITGNSSFNSYNCIEGNNLTNSNISGNTCIRGSGQASDYGAYQNTIVLNGASNNNLVAGNNILGKNYNAGTGTGNTFVNNKYN